MDLERGRNAAVRQDLCLEHAGVLVGGHLIVIAMMVFLPKQGFLGCGIQCAECCRQMVDEGTHGRRKAAARGEDQMDDA